MFLEIKLHILHELPLEEIEEINKIGSDELLKRLEEMKVEFIKRIKREGVEEESAFKEVSVQIVQTTRKD